MTATLRVPLASLLTTTTTNTVWEGSSQSAPVMDPTTPTPMLRVLLSASPAYKDSTVFSVALSFKPAPLSMRMLRPGTMTVEPMDGMGTVKILQQAMYRKQPKPVMLSPVLLVRLTLPRSRLLSLLVWMLELV